MGWFFERIWIALIGVILGGLIVSRGKGPINGWLLVNIATWYAVSVPLIFLHEFGHAMVGRMVGLRVFWISIGSGLQIFEKQILGTSLRINLLPFTGMTILAARTPRLLRLRLWAATFAGPATHFAVLVLCYFAVGNLSFQHLLSADILSAPSPFVTFMYANAFLFLLSLFPATGSGMARADGYRLIRILFWKEKEIAEYLASTPAVEAHEFIRCGNLNEAATRYQAALALNPDSFVLRHDLAIAWQMQGDYERARSIFVELLHAEQKKQPGWHQLLLNNIAWADLMLRRADLLQEADAYSEEVIKGSPNFPSFQGTRGAVLVSMGRVQEGDKLLRKAFRRHSEKIERASVACWIAIAEARTGNAQEARAWLSKAHRLCPWLYLHDWTRQEISDHLFSS
jgi:tetratricopeptide (TPR) repeat protein